MTGLNQDSRVVQAARERGMDKPVREALRPIWEKVYQEASEQGDLSSRLQDQLSNLDTNLQRLAQKLLDPADSSPQSGIIPSTVSAFLDADEPLDEFYKFADGLAAAGETRRNTYLDCLQGWLLKKGEELVQSGDEESSPSWSQVRRLFDLTRPTEAKGEAEDGVNKFHNAVREAVEKALRPTWGKVYQEASEQGDLSGRLREALVSPPLAPPTGGEQPLPPVGGTEGGDLQYLAGELLDPAETPPADGIPPAVIAFLEADDPLNKFVDLANSLFAAGCLQKLSGWCLDWIQQSLDSQTLASERERTITRLFILTRPPKNSTNEEQWLNLVQQFYEKKVLYEVPEGERPAARELVQQVHDALPPDLHEFTNTLTYPGWRRAFSLKEVEKKLSDPDGLSEYMAQYPPRAWQKALEKAEQGNLWKRFLVRLSFDERDIPIVTLVVKVGAGVLVMLILMVVGFVWKETGGTPISSPIMTPTPVTKEPGDGTETAEPPTPTETLIPTPSPSGTIQVNASWPCAAGVESWHTVTITNTGEQTTTYVLQLPKDARLYDTVAGTCTEPGEPVDAGQIGPLTSGQSKEFILILPSSSQNQGLNLCVGDYCLAATSVTPWVGEVTAQLTLAAPDTTFVLTGTISVPMILTASVPGKYWVGHKSPSVRPTYHSVIVTDTQVAVPVVIQLPANAAPGEWQALVEPDTGGDPPAGTDPLNEPLPFVVEEPRYGVEARRVNHVGITWGPTTEQVGLGLIYEIVNVGNVPDKVLVRVEGTGEHSGVSWPKIRQVTLVPTDVALGDYELQFSDEQAIVLVHSDDPGSMLTLSSLPVEDSGFIVSLPDDQPLPPCPTGGECPYKPRIVVWLQTFYGPTVIDSSRSVDVAVTFAPAARPAPEFEDVNEEHIIEATTVNIRNPDAKQPPPTAEPTSDDST